MAHVHLLTTFLNQLDDMETELRLHNLRDLLRVGKVESNRSKGRIEGTTTYQSQLTATTGCSRVFGIETCQGLERSLTFVHTIGIVTQLVFHTVQLLCLDTWCHLDDLHLYLHRHKGDAVLWHIPEITAHLRGRHRDILHELTFHTLHHLTVFHLVTQFVTDLRQ